jgi:hypothetical protein
MPGFFVGIQVTASLGKIPLKRAISIKRTRAETGMLSVNARVC